MPRNIVPAKLLEKGLSDLLPTYGGLVRMGINPRSL